MKRYPRLVIYPERVRENAEKVVKACAEVGVNVLAVTKGVSADLRVARAMLDGGCCAFADSRIRNLTALKKAFPGVERTLLRIPMKSEAADVVENTNCSLVSMPESIEALEAECRFSDTAHRVLLMFDLGDRREGVLEEDLDAFVRVLKKSPHVLLTGVGSNFACFAGVLPNARALGRLARMRVVLEDALGYALPICSGGATSSLMLIERGELPCEVNQLRVGEGILLGLDAAWQRAIPWLRQDTIRLDAEIAELRVRPSLPDGEIGADAFGIVRTFEDWGPRRRAIVALGRQDVPPESLTPLDEGVEILGASSDHTLLDVQNMPRPPRWGDVLSFSLTYSALLALTTSSYVKREYIGQK